MSWALGAQWQQSKEHSLFLAFMCTAYYQDSRVRASRWWHFQMPLCVCVASCMALVSISFIKTSYSHDTLSINEVLCSLIFVHNFFVLCVYSVSHSWLYFSFILSFLDILTAYVHFYVFIIILSLSFFLLKWPGQLFLLHMFSPRINNSLLLYRKCLETYKMRKAFWRLCFCHVIVVVGSWAVFARHFCMTNSVF